VNESADQSQFLLHAAGKLARETPAEFTHAGRPEQFRRALLTLAPRGSEQVGIKTDVFVHRQVFV
jgi:hypothetical protein